MDAPLPIEAGLPILLRDYLSDPNHPATRDVHAAAFEAVARLTHADPDLCWRFLEVAAAGGLSDMETAYVAAGPLEDVLGSHADRLRERVEAAARDDPGMRRMLVGVWQGSMSDADWAWLNALRQRYGIELL